MDDTLQDQLFAEAMKRMRNSWRTRTDLPKFESIAKGLIISIRDAYMFQVTETTFLKVTDKLTEAAEKLQLTISTEVDHSYFRGYRGRKMRLCHQKVHLGIEIYIGPQDVWDKIICFIPKNQFDESRNPYVKKRLGQWSNIDQFDFDALMTSIKNMIDNPPPLETFDDDEDEEHPF
jgi:hypothetical protein